MGNNEKNERFQRVAEKRVNRAIRDLRLVGQCSNRRLYDYTDEQVRSMFSAVESELRLAKQKFSESGTRASFRFGRGGSDQ